MPSASPGEFEEFLTVEEPHSQDTMVPFRNVGASGLRHD